MLCDPVLSDLYPLVHKLIKTSGAKWKSWLDSPGKGSTESFPQ